MLQINKLEISNCICMLILVVGKTVYDHQNNFVPHGMLVIYSIVMSSALTTMMQDTLRLNVLIIITEIISAMEIAVIALIAMLFNT